MTQFFLQHPSSSKHPVFKIAYPILNKVVPMLGLTWKSAPAPRPTDPSSSPWNKDGWGKQSKLPLQAGDKGCSPEKTKHPQLTQSLVLWSLPTTSPAPAQVTSVLPKAAPHMTSQIRGGQGDHSALACSEHCTQPRLDSSVPCPPAFHSRWFRRLPRLKTELIYVLGGSFSLTAETC